MKIEVYMERELSWETYEFNAVNVPCIDARGTRVCGMPGRFSLMKSVVDTKECYRVIAIDIHQKRWTKETEAINRKTTILLSETEINYALEHQQFARINTTDQLAPVIATKRTKKKSPRKG
jgi:hypothetical protein